MDEEKTLAEQESAQDATAEVAPSVDVASDETDSKIVQSDAPQEGTEPDAGVSDGSVDKHNEDLPVEVRDNIYHAEKVVYEKDKDGNVTGWHKEALDDKENK